MDSDYVGEDPVKKKGKNKKLSKITEKKEN